jgi:antitoxin component of RelBE/YafQ-DinJ toxin-antitoxin module
MGMGQLVEVALEIDVALKEQAEKVFAENGLTLEQATILFLKKPSALGNFLLSLMKI